MWFLYVLSFFWGYCLCLAFVSRRVFKYARRYVKRKREEDVLRQRNIVRFNIFVTASLFKRLSLEQQKYCLRARSVIDYYLRYTEILSQDKDILPNFFDEMLALAKSEKAKKENAENEK